MALNSTEEVADMGDMLLKMRVMEEDIEEFKKGTDQFFLIIIGLVIFLMQAGFAFLESGSCRSKNIVNILIKNMLDAFIGGVSYWAIGWGLAYGAGGNPFCGGSQFFAYQLDYGQYASWFFQFVFAATGTTIVGGAIAERSQFVAYFTYSIVITGWVYPTVSHWAWDPTGWLALTESYKDFAGSGVVHLMGGTCAVVATSFMGPRHGRFNKNNEPNHMPGHSTPFAGLGGFILIFGFLAFNGGSQASISGPGDGAVVAIAVVNTILGASAGGLSVLFFNKFVLKEQWSFLMCLNGSLAGMVANCAGCNLYEPWAGLLVGVGGGLSFILGHFCVLKAGLDDPMDAVAVHGFGGLWGIIAVPFFMYSGLEAGSRGIMWDGHLAAPWVVLGYNMLGALVIMCWAGFWCILMFSCLKAAHMLRISVEDEFKGMDVIKHSESAYPSSAWVEYQYNRCNTNGTMSMVKNRMSMNNVLDDLAAFSEAENSGGLVLSLDGLSKETEENKQGTLDNGVHKTNKDLEETEEETQNSQKSPV